MAQLLTPTGIARSTSGNTLTLTWTKPADFDKIDSFNYNFVNKKNPADAKAPTATQTGAITSDDKRITVVFTLGTAADVAAYDDYYSEIQAKPKAPQTDTASAWGKEAFWVAGGSITLKIGETYYTLDQNSMRGSSSIYRLPVSEDNPLSLTYSDLKGFVQPFGVPMPSKYPNGSDIDDSISLDINELVVDTSKYLFGLGISLTLRDPWTFIPSLAITRIGVGLKRTDGSL